MPFKFEQMEVWKMSLDYTDAIYELAEKPPDTERFNLKSQIIRAATSISPNIAEGSTGQTDPEQSRFPGMAIRSLIETVACQRLISHRNYVNNPKFLEKIDLQAQELAKRLYAFRKSLEKPNRSIREEQSSYDAEEF